MKLHWSVAWGIVLGYIGIQLANLLMKALVFAAAALIVLGGQI